MMLFDAHAHLKKGEAATEALLRTMDACGIARAVVVAGGNLPPEQLARHMATGGVANIDPPNGPIADQCQKTDGRLVPFFFANPWGAPDAYAETGQRFAGLKLGPAVHGMPFDDARMDALVSQAGQFDHPIYLHCLARPGLTVADFVLLAMRHSRCTFILGHAGVGQCDFDAVHRISKLPNVYFEMSGGFTSVCQAAIETLGPERVLFGSEYPLQDPRVEIAKLHALELSPDVFSLLAHANIERILSKGRVDERPRNP